MPTYIDTHCHLADSRLQAMVTEVIDRALQAGVKGMVCVGTTAQSSRTCVELAHQYSSIFAAVGIHPTYCHEVVEGDWDVILDLSDDPRVVAIGETGLDLYWKECPLETQLASLRRHWELSWKTSLPVILHMRDCTNEMLTALELARNDGPLRGILHSFTESREVAERLIEMGLHISFAGMVTYKNAEALRQVAAALPSDRILIETDSPYLSPEPRRSQRPNEPALVVHTAKTVADARGISVQELAEITTANAKRVFPKISL